MLLTYSSTLDLAAIVFFLFLALDALDAKQGRKKSRAAILMQEVYYQTSDSSPTAILKLACYQERCDRNPT